jgi:RimJ/RimL family protein N-acetyltransferase
MGAQIPTIRTTRLTLAAFSEKDVDALADILGEPEVSKNITVNASTPEQCRRGARQRIAWHNGSWDGQGYGV